MSILGVKNLSVNYVTDQGDTLNAVEGVSFDLHEGKSMGIVGESGCGKTTLMLSLLRLLPLAGRIVNGQIIFEGRDLLQITEAEMSKYRWAKIAMVFQGAMNALNPVRTIESQIVETILHHGIEKNNRNSLLRAGELLEKVGISPERGHQYPHQFSGGMKQRAVIAMTLACNPKIIIADEPTTALDVMIQAQIIRILKELQDELNLTMVIVTHDLGLVSEICDDVIVMYGGMIAEYGTSDMIFRHPCHPYTKGLLKAFPDINNPGAELTSIPGTPPRLDNLPPGCRFEPRCDFSWSLCREQQPPMAKTETGHIYACHLAFRDKQP